MTSKRNGLCFRSYLALKRRMESISLLFTDGDDHLIVMANWDGLHSDNASEIEALVNQFRSDLYATLSKGRESTCLKDKK